MAKKIPAKYIGMHPVTLGGAGPYYNIDGTRKTDLTLSHGDTIMMEEREVLGQSFKFDPKGQLDPLDLGAGRVVLPEHAHLSDEELALLGYEHHQGRRDFIPLETLEAQQSIPPPQEQTPESPPVESHAIDNPQGDVQAIQSESSEEE